MRKDPLEREREFRKAIERDALARREARIRRTRPWLGWLKRLAARFSHHLWLSVVLIVLLPFGALFLYLFGLHIKRTEPYACTMAQARRSPSVIAELGEPIEAGFFAWNFSYERGGGVTYAPFSTSLSGPKGSGKLYVEWYASPLGSSLRMELHKDGRTHPVYAGAAVCP